MTEFPHVPVVVHQDHGTSPAVCQRSIQLGFSSVMMDGSLGEDGKTPMDYDYNAGVTRHVVDIAHACGVSVEGEIGCLGSLETGEAGEEDGISPAPAAAAAAKRRRTRNPARGDGSARTRRKPWSQMTWEEKRAVEERAAVASLSFTSPAACLAPLALSLK